MVDALLQIGHVFVQSNLETKKIANCNHRISSGRTLGIPRKINANFHCTASRKHERV